MLMVSKDEYIRYPFETSITTVFPLHVYIIPFAPSSALMFSIHDFLILTQGNRNSLE